MAWYDRENGNVSIKRRRSTTYGNPLGSWENAGSVSGTGGVDPALAFNPANNDFYFGWLHNDFSGISMRFRRSPDGNVMDSSQTVVSGFADRPWLSASALSVYANSHPTGSALRFKRGIVDPQTEAVDWSGVEVTYAELTASGEGYVFCPPTPIAKGAGVEGQGGNIYLYSMSKQFDQTDPDHHTGNVIRVHRSTNHGATWDTQGHILTDLDNHPDGYWYREDYGMFNMHILADPAGSDVWAFYVDYEERECGEPGPARRAAVLYCCKSTDHGASWNPPVSVIPQSIYSTLPCSPANYGKLRDDEDNYARDGHFRIGRCGPAVTPTGAFTSYGWTTGKASIPMKSPIRTAISGESIAVTAETAARLGAPS